MGTILLGKVMAQKKCQQKGCIRGVTGEMGEQHRNSTFHGPFSFYWEILYTLQHNQFQLILPQTILFYRRDEVYVPRVPRM
jgi:hypothetical protein